MSLFGSRNSNKPIPEFTGLQVQASANILPIPIIYGSPRVVGNVIYANGFRKENQKDASSGKGLFGSSQPTNVVYFETFILALGEGGLTAPVLIWQDQAYYGSIANMPDAGAIIFFSGAPGQPAWNYVSTLYPTDSFTYPFTAYLGFADYQIDSSATIPQLAFVLPGLFSATSPLNKESIIGSASLFWDADPAQVIYDMLTNTRYGVAFPTAFIDTTTLNTSTYGYNPAVGDAALSTYCQAVGLAFSVVLNNFEAASSILDRWMGILSVALVWTGTILKFIPYWDAYVGTNPGWDAAAGIAKKYFQPNLTVLFDLGDNDFIQTSGSEDPVNLERIDVADVKNIVRFDFKDRANQFNDNVAEATDEVSVDLFGPRVEDMQASAEFTKDTYARQAAQIRLQRNLSVRSRATFKLSWEYCFLDPMDIVTITDASIGLSRWPVRIVSVEEDEKGILTVVAEEFAIGAQSPAAYEQQPNLPPLIVSNVVPAAVDEPLIFEPTSGLLAQWGDTAPQLVIGASASASGIADPNWGGANVFASLDDVTYAIQSPPIIGPSTLGVTTAILAAFGGTNPDNIHTLSVDLRQSGGTLVTVTAAEALAGNSLCVLQDPAGDIEILGYTTATLTASNRYNLTGLYRGLFGTIACSHATGTKFLRLDSNIFKAPMPPPYQGQDLFFKLQSFNAFFMQLQDLSTCVAYPYSAVGSITPATNPLLSALLAGTNSDLGLVTAPFVDPGLDLDTGGGPGPCAPALYEIDLGVL